MRNPQKIFSLALSCVAATVLSVGMERSADANVVNTPGYTHVQNDNGRQCLLADADTGKVEQWRCLNTQTEEWRVVPVSVAGGDYFLLASHWTTQCMAIPSYPSNGTPVIQLPCDDNDVRQYWKKEYVDGNHTPSDGYDDWFRFISLQGALCLDKPEGNNTQGLQIQMWRCNRPPTDFGDQHYEQWWSFSTHDN